MESLQDKVNNLVARSLSNNVVIRNLLETKGEDPKELVCNFFTETLEITAREEEILVAHRLDTGSNSNTMVRCHPDLVEWVFSNAKNLKGKQNAKKQFYYVLRQYPEKIAEDRRAIQEKIKQIKKDNESMLQSNKTKTKIQKGVLYVNGEKVKQSMSPIKVTD